MVAVFRGDDEGQQAGTGQSFVDGLGGLGGDDHDRRPDGSRRASRRRQPLPVTMTELAESSWPLSKVGRSSALGMGTAADGDCGVASQRSGQRRRSGFRTVGAGIFQPDVLPDEQLGGLVVELFANLLADFDAWRLATRADLVRVRHIVHYSLAAEIGGQWTSSMSLLPGPRAAAGSVGGAAVGWGGAASARPSIRSSNKPG